jgi:hypothetical protein
MHRRGLAALALSLVFAAPAAQARSLSVSVQSASEFADAVEAFRDSGGTIRLGSRTYGELVVPARSARPLRIVGMPGSRVERMRLENTQNVSLERVTISPHGEDAILDVRGSAHVVLSNLLVTARGTPYSAMVRIPDSRDVTIRRSTFTHCGDRSPEWSNCLLLWRWASHITVEDNWFHDCRGCDFIHGRFGWNLTIRGNRFERTVPCSFDRVRCGHNDLIELFQGTGLHVENNHFGVYRLGGAQLYVTNATDHVTIVNNVFVGTDRRMPGYHARVALVIGSAESPRVPHYVRVVNNTILTGATRIDGYQGSIRLSSRYGGMKRAKRPIVANNVIRLLKSSWPVCSAAQATIANVIMRGDGCSASDVVGDPEVDARGRPTAASNLLFDTASRRYAPARDITGLRRGSAPDIGAYEYTGG